VGLTATAEEVALMNRFLSTTGLLVAVTLGQTSLSWSQPAGSSSDSVPLGNEPAAHVAVKLPIRLYGDYLLIAKGSIGTVQNLNFLLDTGACPSIVDQKIAHDLKLAEQPSRVNLCSKSVQARQVVIPSLGLGPVHVESLPVLAEDLSFLQKALGFKVHAIVGLDVLRKSSFTINYRTQEIVFGSPEKLTYSVPFETDTPVVTVRMGFQDRRLRVVVDSGGPDLTLFRSRLLDSIDLPVLGTETVADAGGTFQRTKVRIPKLYIGKETVGAQMAFVVDDRKDSGDDFDGVLGVRGLHFWKVAFDFENRRFSWEPRTVPSGNDRYHHDDVARPFAGAKLRDNGLPKSRSQNQ
jgi:hypothetical protein